MPDTELGVLIRALRADTLTLGERPVLWGGSIEAQHLETFLQAWKLTTRRMPWRIWEYVNRISLERDSGLPSDLPSLERGRVFGSGGDLSLRRDAERILWHFVGPNDAPVPPSCGARDFWQSNPQAPWPWQKKSCSVLLWGQEERDQSEQGTGTWREDRVSGVKSDLCYPGLSGRSSQGRVQLTYWEYLWGDVVQAVWWQDLTPWPSSDKEEEA